MYVQGQGQGQGQVLQAEGGLEALGQGGLGLLGDCPPPALVHLRVPALVCTLFHQIGWESHKPCLHLHSLTRLVEHLTDLAPICTLPPHWLGAS